MLDGRVDAAQLHGQMRLGQAAVGAGALQRRPGIGKFAEGMNRNARHGPLMRRGAERFCPSVGRLWPSLAINSLFADVRRRRPTVRCVFVRCGVGLPFS